uniref:Uncharacterized protein n=1 Tax=Trichogramma kaykai TaxID=54128 RepID=A0ABD2WL29_9HYME
MILFDLLLIRDAQAHRRVTREESKFCLDAASQSNIRSFCTAPISSRILYCGHFNSNSCTPRSRGDDRLHKCTTTTPMTTMMLRAFTIFEFVYTWLK